MKFSRKILSAVTVLFAFFAFSSYVSAQNTNDDTNPHMKREGKMKKDGMRGDKKMRGGHRGDRGMLRGLQQLDLTDEQKTQIRGIMESNRTANEPLHQELRALMQKKRDGGSLTETEISRFQEIKEQLENSANQTKQIVLALLTADQRAKYDQMMEQRRERIEQRKQRMQERRQNSSKPLRNTEG